MENTSYALYIAAGTLIAIVIISIVLVRWRSISRIEKTKDEVTAIENKADFNAEYEAYNKRLMYGTDVLSCLNKAQNNNQKYVYNNYYGTDTQNFGAPDREEYFIDVEVTINSPLYDNIKAYYKDNKGKYQRVIGLGSDATVKSNYSDTFLSCFDDPKVDYYYFRKGKVYQAIGNYTDIMWPSGYKTNTLYTILHDGLGTAASGTTGPGSGMIETEMKTGTYGLLTTGDVSSEYKNTTAQGKEQTSMLSALITTVSLKNQKSVNNVPPTSHDQNDWYYCDWTTAASDFKSRKFRCTGSTYNETTGYIEKLTFVEIGD